MFESLESPVSDVALAALTAAEHQAARAAVAQWDAAVAVWQSTPPDFRTGAQPQAYAEIGVALGLSRHGAAQRLQMGEALLSWPLLRALLVGGRLGVVHAIGAVEEVSALGDEALAGRVLQRVLTADGRLGWQDTAGKLRTALQSAAVALDPDGAARRRAERLAAQSQVRLRPRGDGLADLTATGCAEQLTAADRLLDVLAVPASPTDDRTLGQRQIDALVGALAARAGRAVPVELQLQIPVRLAVAGLVAQHDPARTVLPEPLVVVTDLGPDLLDRLQHSPVPPQPDGGPEPDGPRPDADLDRRSGPESAELEEDSLGVDGAGDVDDLDVDGWEFAAEHDELSDADAEAGEPEPGGPEAVEPEPAEPQAVEPEPGRAEAVEPEPVEAAAVDLEALDLGTPAPRAQGLQPPTDPAPGTPPRQGRRRRRRPHDGVPLLLGHGPIDPIRLVELLTDPAGLPVGLAHVQVRRVLIDHTGQAVAADARPVPLHRLLTDPRGLLPALLTRLPEPPPRTDAYQPTAAQARVVRARDRCCTFPGCPRRPRRTDLDHRVRHPDGPTSTANLQVLCRHHHRLKHDGWQCVRHPDGTTTWTSPRGQVRHTTRP